MLESFIFLTAATPPIRLPGVDGERATPPMIAAVRAGAGTTAIPVRLSDDEQGVPETKIPLPATTWTTTLEKEFIGLSKKIALETANSNQRARLDHLLQLRRTLKNPRSAAEILLEYRKRKASQNLMAALQAYVQIHDPANSPWAHAEENLHHG